MFYIGFQGNNSEAEFQSSGAYIFRPVNQSAITIADRATLTVYKVK